MITFIAGVIVGIIITLIMCDRSNRLGIQVVDEMVREVVEERKQMGRRQ
jgi:sugar phosphate permease